MLSIPRFGGVALCAALSLGGCASESPGPARSDRRAPVARPPAEIDDSDAVGRAGTIVIGPAELGVVVEEARILQQWRSGRVPNLKALEDPALRRRVVTSGLDTRLVRAECARRGLTVEPQRLARELDNAAHGRGLGSAASSESLPEVDALNAAIVKRYQTEPAHVRRVVLDLLLFEQLSEVLLDAVPDTELEAQWRAENTFVTIDLIAVPRVPSTREIDRAVATKQAQIAARYTKELGRFQRSERAMVHRIRVKKHADGQGRIRLEQVLERLAAGESFEALAGSIGEGPERRSGGRLGPVTAKSSPTAFALREKGDLTGIVDEGKYWAVYRLDARAPAFNRPLNNRSVQRELAAALLRKADALPSAQRAAERARSLLLSGPDGAELEALVKKARLRRTQPKPIGISGPKVVPGVGVDGPFFDGVLALSEAKPVTGVYKVRQNYVMARLVRWDRPAADGWAPASKAWTETWRRRQKPRQVQRWLDKAVKGRERWVDTKRLMKLPLSALDIRSKATGAAAKD